MNNLTIITLVCLLSLVVCDLNYACQNVQPTLWNNVKVYTGYLPTKETDRGNTALSFVFLGCKKAGGQESGYQNCPTVFWFQGGPCETSFWGNFFGIGPLLGSQTAPSIQFDDNKYTWNQNYNLIFVDQPVGTGFSQYDSEADMPVTVQQAATQLYWAMNEMYTNKNLCYQKFNLNKSSTYLFGQEEAGQVIPELIGVIKEKKNFAIKIKGIGLGNAFTDPDNILAYIGMYAYNNGLIDFNERQIVEKHIMSGIVASRSNNWKTVRDEYENVLQLIRQYSGIPDLNNIRRQEEVDYKFNMDVYFQGQSIKTKWGFNSSEDFDVYSLKCFNKLESSTMIYDENNLEDILQNIPIMFYNGQYDVEVCTICTENWLNKVIHKNQKQFQDAEFTSATLTDGTVYAYQKLAGNLEYVIIKGAGQNVPTDKPQSALKMLDDFIKRHP